MKGMIKLYLVTRNESYVKIFEMTPKEKEIYCIKKEYMEKYPDNLKLKYYETNTLEQINKLFKNDTLSINELNFESYNYQDYCYSTLKNTLINNQTKKNIR